MIKFGFGARQFGEYKFSYNEEVEFAKTNGFDFLQIWYDAKVGLEVIPNENKEKVIKECKFPSIIHAVLDITEIEENVEKLIPILKYLGHKELIIHPKNDFINNGSALDKMVEAAKDACRKLSSEGVALFLENNSKLNPIFAQTWEIEKVFKEIPKLEFLLDLAHINDLGHLKEMVAIKYPKALHVADRHLEVIHEHLPIGEGNIDFKYIFEDVLNGYDGKVIFEITESSKDLIDSKNYISSLAVKQ